MSELNTIKRTTFNVVRLVSVFCIILATAQLVRSDDEPKQPTVERLLIMTIVSDPEHDSFKRFNRSIEAFNLELIVLKGDENDNESAQELKLLRKALATYKNEPNLLIMIVNSYDSILNGNQRDILKRFSKFDPKSRVLFSADSICWPDSSLASKYPPPPMKKSDPYLSSAAYIGFAPSLWDLLNLSSPKGDNEDNQQLYYTEAYLNADMRERIGLRLDHAAELFQSLRSQERENHVELVFDTDGVRLKNLAHSTEPVVVHGRGQSKIVLNSLGNYLARAWTLNDGCLHCNQSKLLLPQDDDALPTVLAGIFIEYPTPFLGEFFVDFLDLNYPRKKIHLIVHNSIAYHDEVVSEFLAEHGAKYASQQVTGASEPEWRARDAALTRCHQLNCDYYLALDSVARIEFPDTLRVLIETNKTIVAPLLNRPTKLWSNFWGSMTKDGYYARSHDYVALVKQERIGVWDVAHVMNAYLVNGKFISDNLPAVEPSKKDTSSTDQAKFNKKHKHRIQLTYRDSDETRSLKPVLMFSHNLRQADLHLYMINTHEFGHLVDPTSYNISLTHPDFYQLADNVLDWERAYLHDNFTEILDDDFKLEQPCQDVFWFPLVSELFCRQLIEIMETFGQWSGGTNHDPRIEGGYESVPTRDIHMKQVGLHDMWLLFLREYVMPVQLKEYVGYEHDPPRANLAFVVRYHPAEQASLQPHHDSSTYTLNIALNSPGIDYQGGGCRFARYNCSVTQSRRGWALIHPGRLTHYHEGLTVTNGTRYIMVTFVDP